MKRKSIDRDELLIKLRERQKRKRNGSIEDFHFCRGIDCACEIIRSAPKVEYQSYVHGEWKKISIHGIVSFVKCSVCGEEESYTMESRKYCPNCGAKMDLK